MKIVHFSTHDVTGGAARAAYRLHAGLRALDRDSTMFVARRAGDDPAVREFHPEPGLSARVRRAVRRRRIRAEARPDLAGRPEGYEQFTVDRTPPGPEVARQLPACDVLNLHWVADFLDYGAFFRALPDRVPLVWTLHDMNAFTGGCHYDDGCGRFTLACGSCPQLASGHDGDLSRRVWERKRAALARIPASRLHVVADSRWLAEEARRSSLLGRFPVTTIHYGLDTGVFSPRDRTAARRALGIPPEAAVLLFVADSLENRRKGFACLQSALQGLRGFPELFLVSIGRGAPGAPASVPHLHLERVEDDHVLAGVYSAADVFVIPSLQEAYGQTALEATSCGTPVVGFDAGGIPDVVRPGATGLLAPTGDAGELRAAIASLLGNPELRAALGAEGRRIAVAEHGLEVQARRYLALYEELLAGRGGVPARAAGAGR